MEEAEKIVGVLPIDEEPDVIEVLADLKPVIGLVLACSGHLEVASTMVAMPMGGAMSTITVLGFDIPAVDTMARWTGVEMTPQIADDLLVIEAEMVRCFAERHVT